MPGLKAHKSCGLSQWFERMESVLNIRKYAVGAINHVCYLALSIQMLNMVDPHVMTAGHDTAYGMPWNTTMKMMTEKYCPRNEIKKLEMKIWDLNVKGTD
ncbi:hypothetical protein Tco_1313906 [Tanacetum coccineum]